MYKNTGWGELKTVTDVTFDLAQYEELLNKIPTEFSAYIRGASAYHNGKMDTAVHFFNTILQLPAEQRKYRSTWASFMLGKILLKKNSAQAFQYFDQTRDMVKTGFRDPLNFAGESLGWQARIDADNARYVDAIHRYAECAQEHIFPETLIFSLTWVCNKILSAKQIDPALVNDPLCRQVLTAYIASENKKLQDVWFRALNKCKWEGVLAGADRLAWLTYQQGDVKKAEEWLEHCDTDSVRAKWVKAKLLLRAGKLSEGAALLNEVSKEAKNEPSWSVSMAETRYNGSVDNTDDISIESKSNNDGSIENMPSWVLNHDSIAAPDYAAAEAADVLLSKQDYIGALDLFIHAKFWPDTAYIAERLIPVQGEESLEQYVATHSEEDPGLAWTVFSNWSDYSGENVLLNLRDLLARRLARQGDWEKAAQYYARMHITYDSNEYSLTTQQRPAAIFSEEARMIASNLKTADDTTQPSRMRAKALFDAAKTLWDDGMELTGTELMPDWAIDQEEAYYWYNQMTVRMEHNDDVLKLTSGNSMIYQQENTSCEKFDPILKVSIDEVKRKLATAAVPYRRYHYRFIASEMMWRCAEMLPDNDPLCAEALYWGGYFLRNRELLLADKFYKALVRRNPNLAIAQEANKLKWFPPKFTDEVLYYSHAKTIRKRTMAMWGAGGAGLLALVALAALLVYKRKKAVEPSD